MKLVSKNFLICSHKISAVYKLNKRPKTIIFVSLNKTLTQHRTLSSVKNPMRTSASNNQLLESYLKLQLKKPQVLPNTSNWLCYEEIQNVTNIMHNFPHTFKRDVNTGLLENNSGYRSKAPIFADNFNLFWSSKVKETYERIRDFPVNVFWAPLQDSLAMDVIGTTRTPDISRDRGNRWFTSKGLYSGSERTRRSGGKIGRLNNTTAEYMALYNKLQKTRLEELKRKLKDIKLKMERKEAEMKKKYSEVPCSPLNKTFDPVVPPNLENIDALATATMKSKEKFDPPTLRHIDTFMKMKVTEIFDSPSSSAKESSMRMNSKEIFDPPSSSAIESAMRMNSKEIFDPTSSSVMATSIKKNTSEGKSPSQENK